jgi:hypothetical protein
MTLTAILIALVFSVLAVFGGTYQSRLSIVHAQIAGCYRGEKDRHDNAEAWFAAGTARARSAAHDKNLVQRRIDAHAALLFLTVARDLNSRTSGAYTIKALGPGLLRCLKVYPPPPFF